MTVVVVTGAGGFVGSAVSRHLAGEGYRVRAIVRASAPHRNLIGVDCEKIAGDLRDATAVARAMKGAQAVFHVAADYRLWARDPDEIRRNNITMTENVMRAALAEGVERVIYTSSVATITPPSSARPSDEASRLNESEAVGAYKRSKIAAERLVERMVHDDKLPAVIVNPSTPIGPRDIRPTPTGRIVVEAASGRMPAFVDTGLNLVHVDDVARGHLVALKRGNIGERYILGGQNVTLKRMLADIAAIVGRNPPRLQLRPGVVMPLAFAAEAWARATGREPFVSRDALRMSRHKMFYSSAKAERELDYSARPYGEALVDAVSWFQLAGYLR
ncbi:hopanoid-associated sugar epimerase [Microvirga terricola]|uniref:NAD-dependent epimerase/dehydratase family protein n=1 Tax=Microvirga terricola TaxID=2719797 RepID=A0ABX0VEH4_9HYPH|nr:hopanoid-associated sugar epimerase [Microvirga terricola]NIX78233.1 NAD-dependent epimerase/dehydratase family protein [Microvirga terricola]